jgi:LysR family hydrogen peroxide-inducible transcriptional activator
MELHQLRYFLAVVREKSFTRAADRLYITQPSLSEQIRKLEGELGSPLFERLGRSLVLTNAGEALLPHAERALQEVEHARRRIQEVQGLVRGRISIGSLPSAANLLLRRLAEFRRAHPGVRIQLHEADSSPTIEDGVHSGEFDLGLIRFPGRRQDLGARLLLEEPLVLVTDHDHPLASLRSVALAQAADQPFVAMRTGQEQRDLLDEACRLAGFEPEIVAEAGQLSSLLGLVTAGCGLTVLPRLAAGGRGIRLRDPTIRRQLGVVWRRRQAVSPATGAMLEALGGEPAGSAT